MTWRDITALFEKMEIDLIKSLKRNLVGHKAWEKAEGFDWPAWQAEKLKNIKRYREQNEEIMKEYHDQISAETEKMLQEQYAEGYKDESEFFDLVEQTEDGSWRLKKADGVPDEELSAEDVKKTPTEDSFFGVNDNRLDKLIEDMQTVETKVESAALRMMDDVYRQTLYKAEMAMAAGATTLPQALDMAVKDFLNAGINCIEYKNGRRVNIDDYAQMALRTAATKAYMQGEARKRDEMGIDTVLISQYGACSETCLPWQGRVYIDDIWGSAWRENQKNILYTHEDPMREKIGSAFESHPEQVASFVNELREKGVELEYRSNTMAYMPSPTIGKPGKFVVDKECSYSVWLHEMQHVYDDESSGWKGFRNFINPAIAAKMEDNAYDIEVDFARQFGYNDIVKRLETLKELRHKEVMGDE